MGGKAVRSDFPRLREALPGIQSTLRELGLDGWLLYDLHARNGVTAALTGVGDLSRRYFVLLPAEGEPHALIHGIERGPWQDWPWQSTVYVGWAPLREQLAGLVRGRRLAMEVSPEDAVPALDLVPWGVVELVRAVGAREIVASGDLVSRFYSAWSDEGLASHRRSAATLAETARAAFRLLAERTRAGSNMHEGELRDWVLERLRSEGTGVGADCIVARTENAANPHYGPEGRGAELREGDVVLLDLWGKEADDAIYADQTWMGYLGQRVPERVAELFAAIRDGRDAGVRFVQERWRDGEDVLGHEVDDVVRGVIRERGLADAFIHRTGHSIDRDTHGMGPNIDNLETQELRRLIPGVGFSVEPGVYLTGDVGLRTEIDVYMGPDGPEVTTPRPQADVFPLLGEWS